MLEIQCGLGVMPQFMNDNGFINFKGIDNSENVSEFWDNTDILSVREPDNTGFDDQQFHLVCWYTMNDGRIDQERIPQVLDEMERIGHGVIILRPFDKWVRGKDAEFLAFMMDSGWSCSDAESRHKMFLFHKG